MCDVCLLALQAAWGVARGVEDQTAAGSTALGAHVTRKCKHKERTSPHTTAMHMCKQHTMLHRLQHALNKKAEKKEKKVGRMPWGCSHPGAESQTEETVCGGNRDKGRRTF